MNILEYVIIGVLQGVFEWLPISSQGNILIILNSFFNIPSSLAFNYSIFLHLGTTFAAIFYFRKKIFKIFNFRNLFSLFKKKKSKNLRKFRFFFIAVLFTLIISGIIYLFFIKFVLLKHTNYLILFIATLLIITGVMQLFNKKKNKIKSKENKKKLNLKNSISLGITQGFSILPGISRSAITTSTLLIEKFDVENAFRYSFILSIPTILIGEIALLVLEGFKFNYLIIISIICAFFVGYFTIDLLLKIAKKVDFSYICFIIAIFYILVIFI